MVDMVKSKKQGDSSWKMGSRPVGGGARPDGQGGGGAIIAESGNSGGGYRKALLGGPGFSVVGQRPCHLGVFTSSS